MKKYSVVFTSKAIKFLDQLAKKDPLTFKRITSVLVSFEESPFQGKALKNILKGFYSYRVGAYRIIYTIQQRKLLVTVIKVGHRRDVYDS